MEPSQEQASPDSVIVGNFNITLPLPNNGQISMMGYVYLSEQAEEVNARMDLFRECIARQQGIAEIPLFEANIEAHEKQIEMMLEQQAVLERTKQGGKKLTSSENQQLLNIPAMIKGATNEVEKGRAKIASVRAKYGL